MFKYTCKVPVAGLESVHFPVCNVTYCYILLPLDAKRACEVSINTEIRQYT